MRTCSLSQYGYHHHLCGRDTVHPAITLLSARSLGQFQVFIMVHQKSSLDHLWCATYLVCGQRKIECLYLSPPFKDRFPPCRNTRRMLILEVLI